MRKKKFQHELDLASDWPRFFPLLQKEIFRMSRQNEFKTGWIFAVDPRERLNLSTSSASRAMQITLQGISADSRIQLDENK